MTDAPEPPVAILAALAVATLTASLGISVASVLLPTLAQSFAATVPEVKWVVLAYLMSVTVAILSAGRLGDLFGPRRMLVAGLVVFIAASILSALAPSLSLLIASRAMQGLGAAFLIALPLSLARDRVPAARLGTAMGIIGSTSAIGTALGPSMGGALLTLGTWQLAFWGLAGIGVLALILVLAAIERHPRSGAKSLAALDIPGTALLMTTLAAFALAMSGGVPGIPIPPVALFCAALVAAALFVIVERRATAPLLPMALLIDRATGPGFVMNLMVSAIMMSTLVVGPFFLAFALGLNDALIGLVLAVGPAVSALSGVPAGRLTDLLGVNRVMMIGLAQASLGLLCLAYLPRLFGTAGYVAALIVLTPSFQMFLAANNTGILAQAAPDQRGRLSGLLGLSRNLGLMSGASVVPALFVAILGTGDAAQAAAPQVARAFSLTFTMMAGLALLTLCLAFASRATRA